MRYLVDATTGELVRSESLLEHCSLEFESVQGTGYGFTTGEVTLDTTYFEAADFYALNDTVRPNGARHDRVPRIPSKYGGFTKTSANSLQVPMESLWFRPAPLAVLRNSPNDARPPGRNAVTRVTRKRSQL